MQYADPQQFDDETFDDEQLDEQAFFRTDEQTPPRLPL